jgi:ethanolamine utilization microcompartment shell protein EutS
MSNARNLARLVVDSNGAVNASNLGNAVPADGSITAAKLAVGAAASNIGDGSITSAKLAVGAAASNIGYTPANKAGDTFTGAVNVTGAIVATNNVTAYGSF